MTEIEQIFELTSRVETLVAEARWGEAAEKEAERRAHVIAYVERHPERTADLKSLQARLQNTLALASVNRKALLAESKSYLNSVRALRAYRSSQA